MSRFIILVSLLIGSLTVRAQSPSEVKQLLDRYKIENKELWYVVYREESGLGTSNLARNYSNLFGMKHPTVRATTSEGATKSGFATYDSAKSSVIDLKLYQLYYLKGFSKEQTLKYLRKTYNPDKNYLKKILGY